MAVTVAGFLVRYPVFDGTPSSTMEAFLADAVGMFDPAAFTNSIVYDKVVMLYMAHSLTQTGLGETTEAAIVNRGFALDSIQSVSDSGVSVSLQKTDPGAASQYSSTSYGRELTYLLRRGVARKAVVGGSEWEIWDAR